MNKWKVVKIQLKVYKKHNFLMLIKYFRSMKGKAGHTMEWTIQ